MGDALKFENACVNLLIEILKNVLSIRVFEKIETIPTQLYSS